MAADYRRHRQGEGRRIVTPHAVIYTPFSLRRNAEDSDSCEMQESLCRAYAKTQGWPVRSVHADKNLSGSDADRPGLPQAPARLARTVWERKQQEALERRRRRERRRR